MWYYLGTSSLCFAGKCRWMFDTGRRKRAISKWQRYWRWRWCRINLATNKEYVFWFQSLITITFLYLQLDKQTHIGGNYTFSHISTKYSSLIHYCKILMLSKFHVLSFDVPHYWFYKQHWFWTWTTVLIFSRHTRNDKPHPCEKNKNKNKKWKQTMFRQWVLHS